MVNSRDSNEVEGIQRATYSISEAAKLLGIGRNAAYEAARRGQLPTLKIGGRVLVPRAALEQMLDKAGVSADFAV